ncbi:hypothetical protein EPVG_00177 [Emiliania huxleyi virus 201]|nr:hypothetical protein ELVG_00125 [Emiliania huxleyi virus 203]AEP15532.1 hypothetical protein EQVG_00122 [Emiliania huxleyi virus 207]AEP15954.1 hypothetical protein ERVG_00076 [Emiliania huxleyi virus 208]AET98064.1 hypothetical protein EPVG_00177 [Emiliania huxleyi virus 201]
MYIDMIDQNKLTDSNKLSFHLATAEYRGKVVCSAPNRAGTHAEVSLLRKHTMQRYRNKNITVYVTRLSKNGHAMSRPCVSCSRYIKAYWPLATVYYTNAEGNWVRDNNLDTNHLCLSDRMNLATAATREKKRRPRSHSDTGSSSSGTESTELCSECE